MKQVAVLFLLLFSFSSFAQITGYIDGIDSLQNGARVRGWACAKGIARNIEIRIFAGGLAGVGQMIARNTTSDPSSSAIHTRCSTPSYLKHRFNIIIPNNVLNIHKGKKVYIHGIHPTASNLPISNSGNFSLPNPQVRVVKVPLLQDISYNRGLIVKDPSINSTLTGEYYTLPNGRRCPAYRNSWTGKTHKLGFGNPNMTNISPLWTLAQWESRANLLPNQGRYRNSKTFYWQNQFKFLQIGRPGGGFRTLTLGLDGHNEYDGRWHQSYDPCIETPHPHLLVEQNIATGTNRSIGRMSKIPFTFKARVLENNLANHLISGWDKNKSTAHFKIHINVKNVRADGDKSKGHGQSFGIGINFFDVRNRDRDYAERSFFHKPRRRMMLDLSINDLGIGIRSKLHSGGWGEINAKDLKPYLMRALSIAIREGKNSSAVDRLISENPNDYYITNFNMGWEVSSPHRVRMQISDFNLSGEVLQ